MRHLIALVLLLGLFAGPAQASEDTELPGVIYHFYGAEDCPPCMAFKRDGLAVVEAAAETEGFAVAVNIVERTRDVPNPGAFGPADPVLRSVAAHWPGSIRRFSS